MTALMVVTGKGGSGKTTVAASVARGLAAQGRRVLCAEVEGRSALSAPMGWPVVEPGRVHRRGAQLGHVVVDPRAAVVEYIDRYVPVPLARTVMERTGLADVASEVAPGLRDVLVMGKLYDLHRRADWDAIVVDAPPTGRIVNFLTASEAVAEATGRGVVHRQGRSMMTWMRGAESQVVLVATPTELAATEAVEAAGALRAASLGPHRLVVNRVATPRPAGDVAALEPAMREFVARHDAAVARQRPWLEMLDGLGVPTAVVAEHGHGGEVTW